MTKHDLKPGWKIARVGNFVECIREQGQPTEEDGCNYIGLEHLNSGSLHIKRWGSDADLKGKKLRMNKGDLLFAKRNAYLRRVAIAPHNGFFSAHGMVLRPKGRDILPEFLPFFLQSDLFMKRAIEISVGSLSPTINWKTLEMQEFPLPPLDEQKRIAEILWAADEAVEKYKVVLRDTICIRDQSFLSEVLAFGWPTKPTSELSVAPVTKGTTPRKGEVTGPAMIPFIKVYNLTFTGDLDFTIGPTYVDKNTHENGLARSKVLPNDVLINIVGPPLGKIAVVPGTHKEWNMNQAIARIRIEDELLRKHFVAVFKTDYAQTWFQKHSKKTSGQQNLTLKTVQDFPVPLPPENDLKRILARFDLADESVRAARKQISALEALMKGLIKRELTNV